LLTQLAYMHTERYTRRYIPDFTRLAIIPLHHCQVRIPKLKVPIQKICQAFGST
jgi:hypothetical protein